MLPWKSSNIAPVIMIVRDKNLILLWAMRAYFVVTLVALIVYLIARAVTPLWLDLAFIAWCVVFLMVWKLFRKRTDFGNMAAGEDPSHPTRTGPSDRTSM